MAVEKFWNEIKDVDVGLYQGAQFEGQHVPTIEATFAAMKEHPTYLAMVDEKGAGPEYIAKKAIEVRMTVPSRTLGLSTSTSGSMTPKCGSSTSSPSA